MNRAAALLLGLSLTTAICAAQSAPCPVKFDQARAKARTTQLHPYGTFLDVEIENTSSQEIRALKVRVVLYDLTQDPTDYVYPIEDNPKLKPRKSYTLNADMPTVSRKSLSEKKPVRVYLLKLLFKDGTVWEDDGTKSCMSPE